MTHYKETALWSPADRWRGTWFNCRRPLVPAFLVLLRCLGMAKLGFLGLGLMGYPMARNLARAGHQVAVWSNTGTKAHQLASEEKAIACASPKQVAEQADFIFACVGDTRMSEEVFTGANGVIA